MPPTGSNVQEESKPEVDEHDAVEAKPVGEEEAAALPKVEQENTDATPPMPPITGEFPVEEAVVTVTTGAADAVAIATGEEGRENRKPKGAKKETLKRPQDAMAVVTRNGKTWNEMADLLQEYKEKNGNCYVPDRYKTDDGVCLGLWVRNQRRRKDSLTEEQHTRLADLGLDWLSQNERFEETWHERFARLTEYRVVHGDCKGEFIIGDSCVFLGMFGFSFTLLDH